MTAIALLLTTLLLALPGARMLSRGIQVGREPELWLGLTFCTAAVGLPGRMAVAPAIAEGAGEAFVWINALCHVLISVSVVFLYVFVWRVFHRDSAWGRAAAVGAAAGSVLTLVAALVLGAASNESHPALGLALLFRAAVFPWLCWESTRYYRLMRRRVPLGLADPVVTNRFLLWSLWSGVFAALPLLVVAVRASVLLAGPDPEHELMFRVLPALRILMLTSVGTACTCLWLSFFPPSRYVERVQERAALAPGV